MGWKAWSAQLFSLIYIPVISNQIKDLQSNTWLTSALNIFEGLVCFGFVLKDYRHSLCPCLLSLRVGIQMKLIIIRFNRIIRSIFGYKILIFGSTE